MALESDPDPAAAFREAEDIDAVELALGDFDSHGTTRSRHNGRSIEIEHGIPGETVSVEVLGGKRQRGRILEVLDASPDRVEAPCPYFRDWACGGCQWQHIRYESQVARKRAAVDVAMHENDLPHIVTRVHVLDDPWRYRSTAGISLGRSAGFRRHGSLAIVPIRDCPISHPLIGRLMAVLNDGLQAGSIPDFRGRVRLDVRVAGLDPENESLQVLIRSDSDWRPVEQDLLILQNAIAALDFVGGVAAIRRDGSIDTIRGERFAPVAVAGRPVWLTAEAFFQTNLRLLPALIDRLRQEALPRPGTKVADIYGGVGIFGLFLALDGAEVVIIESDPVATAAGARTAQEWNLQHVGFTVARAEEATLAEGHFDTVILDPPRAGLSPEFLEMLTTAAPPLILYVSCFAGSLAPDLAVLIDAGYELTALELFDFYPQTYHVELLAVLRKTQVES